MGISDYIKHFDESFGTNLTEIIANRTFPMVELAFNELADEIYALNDYNRKLSRKKIDTYFEFEKTLDNKQKELIDRLFELEAEFWEDTERQLFVFGFCLCYEELRAMGALKD